MHQPDTFRAVPFQQGWITAEKVDAKAIYRRPHRAPITNDVTLDAHGRPCWDFVALPVRRHNDWLAKGFDYVTIADAESLGMVAGTLKALGLDPWSFVMDPRTNSPWHADLYLRTLAQDTGDEHARLRSLVAVHGSDMVEQIMQASNPAFVLPVVLRGIPPAAGSSGASTSNQDYVPDPEVPPIGTTPAARKASAKKSTAVEVPA